MFGKSRVLVYGKKRINGINYNYRTILHRGGGNKRKFRLIDYYMYIWNVVGIVVKQIFDPNKRVILNLISYCNGVLSYSIAMCGTVIGDIIFNGIIKRQIKLGWSTYLFNIKSGSLVTLCELRVNSGCLYSRSAGMYVKLYTKLLSYTSIIKLKSKKKIIVNSLCTATLGIVNFIVWKKNTLNKAGFMRNLGWRPHVRGYAMNPVDHPHGGRTKSGLQVSLWGVHTKGHKTKKNQSLYEIIVKR